MRMRKVREGGRGATSANGKMKERKTTLLYSTILYYTTLSSPVH